MLERLLRHPEVAPALSLPPQALAQAGCFTRSQARSAGVSDRHQRSLLGQGLWVPVVGPVLRPSELAPGPWLRAHAAVLASGRYRAVSHTSASALWGWEVDEALHVIRPGGRVHPGLHEHRVRVASSDLRTVNGIRVTTLRRTLTDLLTGLDFRAAVAAVADGFRLGLFTPDEVILAAADSARRTGAPQAREIAWSCRGRPYSILEWDFHQIAWLLDPDGWEFNVPIRDQQGLIGYVDALHRATGIVVELDGRAYHADRFQVDRSRDQRIACLGLLCVRLTADDVARPLMVVARLRQIMAVRTR